MKIFLNIVAIIMVILSASAILCHRRGIKSYCLTGAFLADKPSVKDITNFKDRYGKNPFLIMIFIDWGHLTDEKVINDVYSQDCVLLITWEPWEAQSGAAIDYDGLLSGKYDKYISDFARQLKAIGKPVFLRFAHEMNGNWYPWSGIKIGKDKYVRTYKYIKDIFYNNNADNVKWIFSVNWEDVPKENNHFALYYPGDDYVDYIGIDGYNWGSSKPWSRWLSFKDIFGQRYGEISHSFKKPVLISEFSSVSGGGDKSIWIKEAMRCLKKMKKIRGFVLFNLDKEADWSFPIEEEAGEELKCALKDSYYKDRILKR